MSEPFVLVAEARGPGLLGIEACLIYQKMQPGFPLIMVREPTNPVHSNAIKLLNMVGKDVCYVDADCADIVAPRMDRGEAFTCQVVASPMYGWNQRKGVQTLKHPARVRIEALPPEEIEKKRSKSQDLDVNELVGDLASAGLFVLVIE